MTWPHVSVSECLLIPAPRSAPSFLTIPRMCGPHRSPPQNLMAALADVGIMSTLLWGEGIGAPSAPVETCQAHRWGVAEPGDPRPATSSPTDLWPTPPDYANPPSMSPNCPCSHIRPNSHGLPPPHAGFNGAVSRLSVSLLTPGTRPAACTLASLSAPHSLKLRAQLIWERELEIEDAQ